MPSYVSGGGHWDLIYCTHWFLVHSETQSSWAVNAPPLGAPPDLNDACSPASSSQGAAFPGHVRAPNQPQACIVDSPQVTASEGHTVPSPWLHSDFPPGLLIVGWGRQRGACFKSNFTLLICCSVGDISKKIISSEDYKSYYYENQLLLVFRVTYTYSLWALLSVSTWSGLDFLLV